MEAFAKIEGADPDKDGATSIEEILAKSNPGDPASTPKRPGNWLSRKEEIQPPRRPLAALFPSATDYRYKEVELSGTAKARAEKTLGRPLSDEERYSTYFEALAGGKVVGRAAYASTSGEDPCIFLVAVRAYGIVAGLRPLHCEDRALKADGYLKGFSNRPVESLASVSPPSPELAVRSRAVAEMARASAVCLDEAAR